MSPADKPDFNVVNDILNVIGIKEGLNKFDLVNTNESLSRPAVIIADNLNELSKDPSFERAPSHYLHNIAGPKFSLDTDVMAKAIEKAQPILEYLDREWKHSARL